MLFGGIPPKWFTYILDVVLSGNGPKILHDTHSFMRYSSKTSELYVTNCMLLVSGWLGCVSFTLIWNPCSNPV